MNSRRVNYRGERWLSQPKMRHPQSTGGRRHERMTCCSEVETSSNPEGNEEERNLATHGPHSVGWRVAEGAATW